MVLVVARPQCVVASAGVGIVVGCARDRTSKEMVSPDRSNKSDLVANAAAVSAVSAYPNVIDVVAVAFAFAAAAAAVTSVVVVVTASAAVTIAAVTTTVNAAVTVTANPATANTAVFDVASMFVLAANQASSASRQTV
ncbi:uncharacterized protein LOC108628021 [Ceratina calcarata]|uniref:Uncharacterized protein LOC108628021 n=1 Tax=Ceratina calcarata TaxID=156304 RepID=A0AAJ7J5F5_9HYME|nr:uncharacterized protein LOC108628021 [Ceratina calcarata]